MLSKVSSESTERPGTTLEPATVAGTSSAPAAGATATMRGVALRELSPSVKEALEKLELSKDVKVPVPLQLLQQSSSGGTRTSQTSSAASAQPASSPPRTLPKHHVCVQIYASSLNYFDLLMLVGQYQYKPKLPVVIGSEAAGRVVMVGEGVRHLKVGQSVIVSMTLGCHADYCVVNAMSCLPMPSSWTYAEAAGFSVGYFTAYHALVQRAHLPVLPQLLSATTHVSGSIGSTTESKSAFTATNASVLTTISLNSGAPTVNSSSSAAKAGSVSSRQSVLTEGQRPFVLVTGAAGGMGLAAVQLAHSALGCRVIGVISKDEYDTDVDDIPASGSTSSLRGPGKRAKAVLAAGAERCIDLSQEDLRTAVLNYTGKRGVDVIYDVVGGDLFKTLLRVAARGCKILVVGFASGRIPNVPANLLLVKSISLIGVAAGAEMQRDPRVAREMAKSFLEWTSPTSKTARELVPVRIQKYAARDVRKAYIDLAQRKVLGKAVLIWREEANQTPDEGVSML